MATIDYKEKYEQALEVAQRFYNNSVAITKKGLEDIFPELKESEDERIMKDIIWCIKHSGIKESNPINPHVTTIAKDAIAWLEKQVPVDEDEIVKGVRRGVAISLMNHIDANSKGMCLSNIECEDIENAIVNEDWNKVYGYMKKKLEKQSEQKPVDTAKQEMSDEEYCSLCMDINCDGCPYVDKSKHKEQKPVEWSEEDETVRNDIIAKLAILKSRAVDGGAEKEICEMEINWLKSLRPQNTWKPSDEQMAVLNEVINYAANSDLQHWSSFIYTLLKSLREQLKKLRGE